MPDLEVPVLIVGGSLVGLSSALLQIWIERKGHSRSTLDLLGTGFTLLAGPRGAAWCTSASLAASQSGVRLDAYILEAERFPESYGISSSGAVLVRPDGVIGWRAAGDEGSAATISHILSTLLCR